MADQMMIRIDPDLKKRLARLARAEGKSSSQMVRELVCDYLRQRDISFYIDGLWDRIGAKLAARGASPSRTRRAISEARKGRQ